MCRRIEPWHFKDKFVKLMHESFLARWIKRMLPVILVFSSYACYHEPDIIDQLSPVCFDTQVLPIIQTSCGISGCHDGSAEGFLATDYASIMRAVTPGDPRGSTLYNVITKTGGEAGMMPPDRPLTEEQRTIIHVWIAQGAESNNCSDGNPGGGTGSADSICFVQNILPIFIANCSMTGCHDGLSQGEEELYALNSYASIIQHVRPFYPNDSKVYEVLNASGEDQMPPPPRSPLTSLQKEMIHVWIADGALNSDCPDANCDTTGTIGFTAQIQPILENYCVSCHNASLASGGINLNGYSQVKTQAETLRNGTPILVGTIRHLPGFVAMPPSTALDECSIRKVELWIEQGILNN